VVVVLLGVTHGVVVAFAPLVVVPVAGVRVAAVVLVAEVAEPGVLFAALAADVALPGVLIAGHGAVVALGAAPRVFVVVVVEVPVEPVIGTDEVAPAGTLLFGFVVEVADPGVLPGFVVFCCMGDVVELALPGVALCVGVMPGLGWMPGDG
jgi:hypothetical protein